MAVSAKQVCAVSRRRTADRLKTPSGVEQLKHLWHSWCSISTTRSTKVNSCCGGSNMSERIISRRDFLQISSASVAGAALLSGCAFDGLPEAVAVTALARPDFGV